MPATCWGKMFHAWAKVIGKVSSPTVESYMWRKTVVMMWLATERRSWWQRWGAGDRDEELVTNLIVDSDAVPLITMWMTVLCYSFLQASKQLIDIHILKTLVGNDSNLVKYMWVIGSDRQCLVEEPLCKFRVVCQSVFQADIQQRQMTSAPYYSQH